MRTAIRGTIYEVNRTASTGSHSVNARTVLSRILFVLTVLILMPAATSVAQEPENTALREVASVQTVFDFRVADPEVALAHLNLIHSMLDHASLRTGGARPEIVVVFIGPSVDLVSTEKRAAASAARKAIAGKIAAMDADGVTFEICMTTARAHDLSAESILPEIVQVGNGWISLIEYQQKGYSMIADF
jgi:intracellular sulfur oxidation DsrE/DsrF family protein